MNKQTATLLFNVLKKLYERDRDNVYTLPRGCQFLLHAAVPAYDGKYWCFEPKVGMPNTTVVTLKAYGEGVNDGASWAPDSPKGVKEGAAAHDPGYLEMGAIAEAWADQPYMPGPVFERDWVARRGGYSPYWTAADVRQLFDAIFGDAIAEVSKTPIVTRAYYSAVRYFGGLFHSSVRVLRVAGPLLLVLTVVGCSGCLAPPDIAEWPNGLPEPVKKDAQATGGLHTGLEDGLHTGLGEGL